MIIIAPNKNYNGISAGVPFINGIGMTDVPDLINWFTDNGYSLKEEESIHIEDKKSAQEEKPDLLSNMSVEQLIEFAKDNNIDIGNATSKAGILKKIHDISKPADGGDADDNEG